MDIDVLKKALTVQFMGVIFLVMGLVGSVMALLPALSPFFLAHFLPALIILICVLVFFLWKGAGRTIKMTLAIVSLVLGLWLVINVLVGLAMPALPGAEELVAGLLAGDLTVLAPVISLPTTLFMGAVGGLIVLIGSIFGIVGAKG